MEEEMPFVRLGKYFLIRSRMNDNLVLECDTSFENNVKVAQYMPDYKGDNTSQLWYQNDYAKRIYNKKSRMTLQADGNKIKAENTKKEGKNLYIDSCHICLQSTNLVMELVGGTTCELKPRNADDILQNWKIENIPALYFYIKSRNKPNMVIDVRGDDTSAGAKLILYENKGELADNQLWCEDERGRLRNKLKDFLMDMNSHNEMLVNPYLNEDAAGWVIEEGGRIKNIRNSNMVVVHKSKGFILGCAKIVAVSRAGIANEEDSLWDFEFLPRQSISLTHSGMGKEFLIRNRKSGMTLEVVGDSVVKNSPLQLVFSNLVPSSAPPKQQFYRDELTGSIRSCLRNFAIEATEAGLILSGFDPYNKMQAWMLNGSKLLNRHDSSLLIQADPKDNGKLSVAVDENKDFQQWEFCHIPAKCFFIKSTICDKVIDVRGANASAGASAILYERNNPPSDNQLWYEDETGLLRSKLNGYVMDTSEEKVKVVPYNPASTDQHWVIVGDHIENRYNKHLVIDLKGEHTMNNTSLIKYHFHGGDNQRWKFEYVD